MVAASSKAKLEIKLNGNIETIATQLYGDPTNINGTELTNAQTAPHKGTRTKERFSGYLFPCSDSFLLLHGRLAESHF